MGVREIKFEKLLTQLVERGISKALLIRIQNQVAGHFLGERQVVFILQEYFE